MEAAASIAGLVALADLVFRYSTKYVKSFKGARKEVEDISREISNLSLVLHRLSFVAIRLAETQSSDGTEVPSNITLHHLYDCQELLTRLRKRLGGAESEIVSESRIKKIQGQLKWPFSTDEAKGILQDLERQKQTIDLAFAADSLNSLMLLLSRQSATNTGINQVQGTLQKILDTETTIILNKKRKSVLQFFTKANPSSEFYTNRGLRKGLTGLWLTQGPEFEEWYRTPGSRIWCSGIPGAGKSVLAAAIIDECLQRNAANPGAGLAYFFCTYRDKNTQHSTSILASLCSQLARQNENAFRILEEYHDELASEHQLQAEASTKELIKVLRIMCPFFSRVYLIVDGLDECGEQVEKSVKSLAALLPYPDDDTLNLALLSRDEVAIREIAGNKFQNIEIEAHTEDIQLYVATELEQYIASGKLILKDVSLKDEIMTRLVNGAKGMFRWVACQLDHLCELPTDRARRKALDKLPPTLFDTYERILNGVNNLLEENKQLVQKTLLLISSPYHVHLSLRQICEAISIPDDEKELLDGDIVDGEKVLRLCSSLVRKRKMRYCDDDDDDDDDDNVEFSIEFSHFSVQEYLQGPCLDHSTLSAYGVSRKRACHLLASLCLDHLTLENYEPLPEERQKMIEAMEERDLQRPFYRHAATCWPFYVREAEAEADEDYYPEAMLVLFQPSKTASFCSWEKTLAAHVTSMAPDDYEYSWFEAPYDFDTASPFSNLQRNCTPLHMAAALGMPKLCKHLLHQGTDVNSNGKFGTPLHCAIVGPEGVTRDRLTPRDDDHDLSDLFDQGFGRRESTLTVQVLLEAGANPDLGLIDDEGWRLSSLSLVAIWSYAVNNLGIAIELIKAGTIVEEEDLPHFQECFNHVLCRAKSGGRDSEEHSITSLLEALGHPDTESEGTPKSRLYTETYNCAARLGIPEFKQLRVFQPTASLIHGDSGSIALITEWVKKNEHLALSLFLGNNGSEVVKSAKFRDDTDVLGWTAAHLAVHHKSLDALDVLLDYGIDVDVPDRNGMTPAHLCQHEDSLRALLQHRASTLVPNKNQETVWHFFAKTGKIQMLNLLLALDVRQQALQMVSSSNETPICAALNHKNRDAVQLLLNYCTSRDFWKSGQSIFRRAAELGSSEVIRRLLDLGIEVDGIDDMRGSPLYHVSTESSVECIRLLKGSFPLEQRRKEDLRTPVESLLLRAVALNVRVDSRILEAMIPGNAMSCPNEASILWSYASFVFKRAVDHSSSYYDSVWDWLPNFVFSLIELGIMGKYEGIKGPPLLPFVSPLIRNVPKIHKAALGGFDMPPRHCAWPHISNIITHIATRTSHWDSARAVDHLDMAQLLSLCALHDDHETVSLLLEKGASVHSRVEGLSVLEFACVPDVLVQESFAPLLKHANPEKMIEGNENFEGCGPLHFVAGWQTKRKGCALMLKQLLQVGVDPNLPLSAKYGSPLIYHIRRGAIDTAEILLKSGADPWARGSYPFDAPLQVICDGYGHHEILTHIAAINPQSPGWDRKWVADFGKVFSGGNALHLAALKGNTECLQFYLDQGLLSDLECEDDALETPMHYASQFGQSSTIKYLHAHGGNIDARNCKGWTPLHFAASGGFPETVVTLINLGAKQQACNDGCIPLTLAFASGDAATIESLQRDSADSEGSRESQSSIISPVMLRILASAMHEAILRGDAMACEKIHAHGCPIDAHMEDGELATPLAIAVCEQEDVKVVQQLLNSGATVSIVFPRPYQGRYSTPLEAAIAHPSMNSLLPRLLNKYLSEGASFLDMDQSPLHVAVEHRNLEGLQTLLRWLRDMYEGPNTKVSRCLARDSISQCETLSALVNQHHANDSRGTALHLAAEYNNRNACAALIDSRANTEELNVHNETPLHVAARCGSLQVAEYLLQNGARPNPLDVWAETPLMSAYRDSQWELVDLLTPYCKDMMRTNHIRENGLHFMTMNGLGPARKGVLLKIFSRCLEQGASLYLRDNEGVAPIHCIMASESACHLRFLLNKDHYFLQPQEISQWPRDWFFASAHKLAAISKNLRLIRPFLSKHELCQISGVAERGSHSLLCRAACWGSVEVIESLLTLGVDMIEHQCNDHGTPLTTAVSRGHTEAVKCLVRNGATIPYDLCQPSDFEVSEGNPDFVIREWLFVGRYVERRRISNAAAEASGKIVSWAGVRTSKVALKWEWKRRCRESIWEYACRRQKILKDVRGKVVKCVEGADKGSVGASNVKSSGRHDCLGQGRKRGRGWFP